MCDNPVLELLLAQKRNRQANAKPINRLTLTSPYRTYTYNSRGNVIGSTPSAFTPEDISMRRKAEILKYNHKHGRQSSKQRYASMASGNARLSAQNTGLFWNFHNCKGQSRSSRDAGIPGPVFDFVEDPAVPLYGFAGTEQNIISGTGIRRFEEFFEFNIPEESIESTATSATSATTAATITTTNHIGNDVLLEYPIGSVVFRENIPDCTCKIKLDFRLRVRLSGELHSISGNSYKVSLTLQHNPVQVTFAGQSVSTGILTALSSNTSELNITIPSIGSNQTIIEFPSSIYTGIFRDEDFLKVSATVQNVDSFPGYVYDVKFIQQNATVTVTNVSDSGGSFPNDINLSLFMKSDDVSITVT